MSPERVNFVINLLNEPTLWDVEILFEDSKVFINIYTDNGCYNGRLSVNTVPEYVIQAVTIAQSKFKR